MRNVAGYNAVSAVPRLPWIQFLYSQCYLVCSANANIAFHRILTSVHCPQHTCNKFVDTIALFDKRYKRGNTTFVVAAWSEMYEYNFLETVYLILKTHQVADCFIAVKAGKVNMPFCIKLLPSLYSHSPFIGIINVLQTDVFFILKCTIEFGMNAMIVEFIDQQLHVVTDEKAITPHAFTSNTPSTCLQPRNFSQGIFQNLYIISATCVFDSYTAFQGARQLTTG